MKKLVKIYETKIEDALYYAILLTDGPLYMHKKGCHTEIIEVLCNYIIESQKEDK